MPPETAIHIDPALPQALQSALNAALAGPPERVRRVAADGRAVWLKQTEQLSLRWRLQKGDTRRAFEADRAALHDLAALGLPVPDLVAEGPNFFATLEAGEPLSQQVQRLDLPSSALLPQLEAAGRALGRLHAAGVIHGRPKLRDICWDGQEIRFIDFERYQRGRSSSELMAQDMMVLLHSLFTIRPEAFAEAEAALRGWMLEVNASAVAALKARPARLWWLNAASRLVLKLRPTSREMRAMPITLKWISAQLR